MPKTYEDDEVKIWVNNVTDDYGNKSEEVRQMNIKDKADGTHTYYQVSSGKQGVAFEDYRPSRDQEKD